MRLSLKSPVNRYNITETEGKAYRIISESISEIMRTNEDKKWDKQISDK